MKKTWIAILTLALTGAASSLAQAETVTSVNAVGMVRISVNSGQLTIVNFPFSTDGDTDYSVSELFDNLPNGTRVHFWIDQSWVTESKGRGGWSPNTTPITRATAMFIDVPSDEPEPTYEVIFSGVVPGSNEMTSVLPIESGLNLISFPYPTAVSILEAGFTPGNGDAVHFWTGTSWATESFGRGSWSPGTTVIQPGQGFFYASGGNYVWESNKPYLWP